VALSHARKFYAEHPKVNKGIWGAPDGHLFLNESAGLGHCKTHKLPRQAWHITRAMAEAGTDAVTASQGEAAPAGEAPKKIKAKAVDNETNA